MGQKPFRCDWAVQEYVREGVPLYPTKWPPCKAGTRLLQLGELTSILLAADPKSRPGAKATADRLRRIRRGDQESEESDPAEDVDDLEPSNLNDETTALASNPVVQPSLSRLDGVRTLKRGLSTEFEGPAMKRSIHGDNAQHERSAIQQLFNMVSESPDRGLSKRDDGVVGPTQLTDMLVDKSTYFPDYNTVAPFDQAYYNPLPASDDKSQYFGLPVLPQDPRLQLPTTLPMNFPSPNFPVPAPSPQGLSISPADSQTPQQLPELGQVPVAPLSPRIQAFLNDIDMDLMQAEDPLRNPPSVISSRNLDRTPDHLPQTGRGGSFLCKTFSIEAEEDGVLHVIDLVPDGRTVPVTDENEWEYARLVSKYRLQAGEMRREGNHPIFQFANCSATLHSTDPDRPYGVCTVCVEAGVTCSGRSYPLGTQKEKERIRTISGWGVNPADVMLN
jgi:HECT-domain (ubiquitin-transferase)